MLLALSFLYNTSKYNNAQTFKNNSLSPLANGFYFYYRLGYFLDYSTDGSFKGNIITLHKNIATTIIFLFFIRICWRFTHPFPHAKNKIVNYIHFALYIVLILIPISGCLFSWTAGHPAPVLYLFNLPQLIDKNPTFVTFFKPLHIYFAWFVGALILLHILAALKHHFIDKDEILKKML